MNNITISYTHAVPYIREHLVTAMGQAYAFARSLEIMSDSEDQTPIEGVGGADHFDARDFGRVRRFLGSDHDFTEVMGMPAVEPVPYPWEES